MSHAQLKRFEERIDRAWTRGHAEGVGAGKNSSLECSPFPDAGIDTEAFRRGLVATSGSQRQDDVDKLVKKLMRWQSLGTNIGWCHHTWNWWTGCWKVSTGCLHCYAETWAARTGREIWGRHAKRQQTGTWHNLTRFVNLQKDPMWRCEVGLALGERPRVFVGSLMDWAENRDPAMREIVAEAWDVIRATPSVDFLMLTKRPQNIQALLPADWGKGWPHVWMMTSVESGNLRVRDAELRFGDGKPAPVIYRVSQLLQVPAAVHAVSYEPALGPLAQELRPFMGRSGPPYAGEIRKTSGVDWVIYGGESGPKHRAEGTLEDPKLWARDMRDVCRSEGIAFYHKQSAHFRNENGVELDGKVLHDFPSPQSH